MWIEIVLHNSQDVRESYGEDWSCKLRGKKRNWLLETPFCWGRERKRIPGSSRLSGLARLWSFPNARMIAGPNLSSLSASISQLPISHKGIYLSKTAGLQRNLVDPDKWNAFSGACHNSPCATLLWLAGAVFVDFGLPSWDGLRAV